LIQVTMPNPPNSLNEPEASHLTNLVCAVLWLVICVVCLIFRACVIVKNKTADMKFACMGLCSITFAVFLGFNILKLALVPWGVVTVGKCQHLFNISVFFYAVHRTSFHGFFVMRLAFFNTHGHISSFKINALKCCVTVYGSFLFAVPLFMNELPAKYKLCPIRIEEMWIAFGFVSDMILCVWSSYMFIQPIMKCCTDTGDKKMHLTFIKETACLTISLISTIIVFLIFLFCDGEEYIAGGFDCTVKTFCLTAIATPIGGNVKLPGRSKVSRLCFDCLKHPNEIAPNLSFTSAISVLTPTLQTPLQTPTTDEIEKLFKRLSLNADVGTPRLCTEYSRTARGSAQTVIELANLKNISDDGSLFDKNGETDRISGCSTIRRVYYVQHKDEGCETRVCMEKVRLASSITVPFVASRSYKM